MKIATILILSLSAGLVHGGPIFPSRCIILAPEFRKPSDTTKGAAFLRQQGLWGNLAKGFNSTGDRYGWSVATGAIIQFVEWEHSSIFMQGDFDVLADTYNDISFNPRAIFWTEGFVYADKIDRTELQLGYIHRCHHDIDNLDTNRIGTGERRTLIYGSVMLRSVWRDVDLAGMHSDLWAQADEYLIKQDTRTPDAEIRKTDIEKLNSSISGGGKIDIFEMGSAKTYIRASATIAAYESYKTFTIDRRAEAGIELSGDALTMDIFLGYESFQDDLNRPAPVDSKYPYIGFRFVSRNIGL
ncbi:MAG: hypothetical protein Q8916_14160 [Bacteroidota bacterium]|nr:hypothetical protein [Bacteroidota bacterium]MDP4231538.1 hypothetical protein [Bacteroidota bacterium]